MISTIWTEPNWTSTRTQRFLCIDRITQNRKFQKIQTQLHTTLQILVSLYYFSFIFLSFFFLLKFHSFNWVFSNLNWFSWNCWNIFTFNLAIINTHTHTHVNKHNIDWPASRWGCQCAADGMEQGRGEVVARLITVIAKHPIHTIQFTRLHAEILFDLLSKTLRFVYNGHAPSVGLL